MPPQKEFSPKTRRFILKHELAFPLSSPSSSSATTTSGTSGIHAPKPSTPAREVPETSTKPAPGLDVTKSKTNGSTEAEHTDKKPTNTTNQDDSNDKDETSDDENAEKQNETEAEDIDDDELSGPEISRESIAEMQKDAANTSRNMTTELIQRFVPNYVLGVDPKLKKAYQKNKDGGKPPSILAQQVSRAIGSAKLNVYLSYIPKVADKARFLEEYALIKDRQYGKTSIVVREMKQLARKVPLRDASGEEVKHTEDKKWFDKDGTEKTKKLAGKAKSAAFDFEKMANVKLKLLDERINELEVEIQNLKNASAGNSGASMNGQA